MGGGHLWIAQWKKGKAHRRGKQLCFVKPKIADVTLFEILFTALYQIQVILFSLDWPN